jgi:hypothetical protein
MTDITINGSMGMYRVAGVSDAGREWVSTNVCFEAWQEDAGAGVVVEGNGNAQEIAEGAIADGLDVDVNGVKFSDFGAEDRQ